MQGASLSGPNTSQPHAKPFCTLLKVLVIYLFFMVPYAWNILRLPHPPPSLPSEFLMVLLLGSGVTYLLGQGTAPDTCILCGASMISLFTWCCHYLFTFPTGLGAP